MYVRVSGKPVFDANGEFRGYRGSGSDVTAIMRAQEALRESERRSRSVIDGIAGLVTILAPNGELETANRQVFDYFGRSLEWVKNWGTNDAVHPEDLPVVLTCLEKRWPMGRPSTSNNACDASTANIGGLTTAGVLRPICFQRPRKCRLFDLDQPLGS
jgi:PAS domain-containing protein